MVGFMNVSLRTDIGPPLERLEAVHREALSAKAYAEALGPRFAVELADVMPGNVLSWQYALPAPRAWPRPAPCSTP